jgi:quinoprotein glucose dehydrogenase
MAAVDLRTNKIAWMHKNGTIVDSAPLPVPMPLGVPSLGGTIVTAGGHGSLGTKAGDYVIAYTLQ